MLIDARTVPANSVLECEVCIVGGGAAGITLARELMSQGSRVCVLESGGLDADPESQTLGAGEIAGVPSYPLDRARLRQFGGCTMHWGGWSRPLDDLDFEDRPWIPNSGWPFSKKQLDPYYERAQKACGLGEFRYDFPYWEAALNRLRKNRLPFSTDRIVDYMWHVIPPPLLKFGDIHRAEIEHAPNVHVYLHANVVQFEVDKDARAVKRLRVACLDGRRFFVSAKLVALACGGIENARLLLASDETQATGLGNGHDLVGRYFMDHPYVRSGQVVLSHPSALYTRPMIPVGDQFLAAGLGPSPQLQRSERIPNFCARLLPVRPPWMESLLRLGKRARGKGNGSQPASIAADLLGMLSRPDRTLAGVVSWWKGTLAEQLRDRDYRICSLHYILEQFPNPESRVTLSAERDPLGMRRARLDWRLTAEDRAFLRRTQKLMQEEFRKSGLGRLEPGTAGEEESWPSLLEQSARIVEDLVYRQGELELPMSLTGREARSQLLFGSHHHLGTTRMNDDARKGVVDRNCRVHGVSNLYVAGSSVFPAGGISNPTLTLLALTIRLADHLKEVMTGGAAGTVSSR